MKKTPAARKSAPPTARLSPHTTLEPYSTWLGSKVHRLAFACLYGRLQAMPPWEELELLRQFTIRLLVDPYFGREFVEFIARPQRRMDIMKEHRPTPYEYRLFCGAKREQERRNREYGDLQMRVNATPEAFRDAFLEQAEKQTDQILASRAAEVDHLTSEERLRFKLALAGFRMKEPSPDFWNVKTQSSKGASQ